MAQYLIDFASNNRVEISEIQANNASISLSYIELLPKAGEVSLPLSYDIVKSETETLIGKINSYMPNKERISFSTGNFCATLNQRPNETFSLSTQGGRIYDTKKINLEELIVKDDELTVLKERGFQARYTLKNSQETVRLDFYEKEGVVKALLVTQDSSYEQFLPLVLRDRIVETTKDITIKINQKTIMPSFVKKTQDLEETDFTRFVKENYKPQISENEFPFISEDTLTTRFFEYMDTALRPVLLNGPTGNGKTVLGRYYASERKLPFYFDPGNSSFRLSQSIGKFTPVNGSAIFTPGGLTLAAIHGGVYVLEEMAQVPQDELTGLNIFLETGQLPLITHFGHEVITAHKDFKFVATGNFHHAYTTNALNDATLQRFTQLKIPYPTRDVTIEILLQRAEGLEYEYAELITNTIFEMRDIAKEFDKDLGLKGAVEVAQRISIGTEIPFEQLIEDSVVNPLITYENGAMKAKLMEVVKKRF